MTSSRLRHPGALGVLRTRAWRPLLLAFAVLAMWAQILSSARAMPHGSGAVAVLCLASGTGSGANAQDEAPALAQTERPCPSCRLPELPAALPGVPAEPVLAQVAGPVPVRARDPAAPARVAALHPARGPPVSEPAAS